MWRGSSWHYPTTPVTSSSNTDGSSLATVTEEVNFLQSLFNPPSFVTIMPNTDWRSLPVITSANTAANPGPSKHLFKGPLCAPPACVNPASPHHLPRDASYMTSKGSLSTLLSSAPNGHSLSASRICSNAWIICTMLQLPRHLLDHVIRTWGSPVPFTMHHTHSCTAHSGNEQQEFMSRVLLECSMATAIGSLLRESSYCHGVSANAPPPRLLCLTLQ